MILLSLLACLACLVCGAAAMFHFVATVLVYYVNKTGSFTIAFNSNTQELRAIDGKGRVISKYPKD